MAEQKRQQPTTLRKIWHFLWVEDSIASWVVSILVAFIFIKFIFYPGLGFLLDTQHPVVAVVSGSMEHQPGKTTAGYALCGTAVNNQRHTFEQWWETCGAWYQNNPYNNITQDQFREFPFSNGFNKGDIMVLRGKDPSSIDVGDVIVYATQQPYPIIHRVVAVRQQDGAYFFTTKGDNNAQVIRRADYEENIKETQLIGTAAVRIPYLGYVKIFAVEYIAQPIANIFK